MSDTGKQSPLGVNTLSGLLQGQGIAINAVTADHTGASTSVSDYTYGTVVDDTDLRLLTRAIRKAYVKKAAGQLTSTTYGNIITIGSTTIPALGNTPGSTYTWTGDPGWGSALYTDEIASYGYVRLFAWQANDEYDYNQTISLTGKNTDLLASMQTAESFIEYTNKSIMSIQNSLTFLDGTYSNMNDLITGDVSGVSLALIPFGQDFINTGKAINLATISTFGLPSNLLETLKKYNAITPSLSAALLSTGLTVNDIEQAINNVDVTKNQQQNIYSAFLIITGVSLADILIRLNCKVDGLETLADLLNVRKLFPRSYLSLTVPVYNTTPGPTNSKTYYPIFTQGSVTTAISNPIIASQVGTQQEVISSFGNSDKLNIQILPEGFGSYLVDILPPDVAVSSGAFSASMQQIKNIFNIPVEKFAKVIPTLETTKNLNVNGTSVPTSTTEAGSGLDLIALGSGPYGTYTTSDFFGCMSGLPYDWEKIQTLITDTQTTTLANIYKNLYLATSWEQAATPTVTYTFNSGTGLYTVTGISLATPTGGGYGRGGAAAPTVTLNGGTATVTIGTDDTDLTTYGKVTSITLVSGGTTGSVPTASIAAPPGSGWPSMDSVIQGYIDSANAEIASLYAIKENTNMLDLVSLWAGLGTQLTIEQRARVTGLPPLPSPRDGNLNAYPLTQVSFTDSIPQAALKTEPHQAAQTLEAVANLCQLSGESMVGMMRESRNKARLAAVGIPQDNGISDAIPPQETTELIANGTLNGTPPAVLKQADCTTGDIVKPEALGAYANNNYNLKDGGIAETGAAIEPGSLAGSPYSQLIDPSLNAIYTSDVLLPASYSVAEAIDEVIKCNCDCWIQ